jgi:hypothetical protein
MFQIGFVDHHLNNFHANKFLSLLHGPLADLEARVVAAWESDPTGDDWCRKNEIPRYESAAAVSEAVDAVFVLAPDNIDAHPTLTREVFPAGKPTVVDKFLGPNLDTAQKILANAQDHGVSVFSASALRFAVELQAALKGLTERPSEAFTAGMGEWEHYGVHALSMLVRILGADAAELIDTGNQRAAAVTLAYADGSRGWVNVRAAANQWEVFPWSFGFRVGDRYVTGAITDFDGFYANLMRNAVAFCRTGESAVSTDEMLRVVAILEQAGASRNRGGVWLPLD